MNAPRTGEAASAPRGFFSPACASCGKGGLRTISSKHRSANAGFCPECGVFVCFDCAPDKGFLNWKQTCPACRKRLRTNNVLFFVAYLSGLGAVINMVLARWDIAIKVFMSSGLLALFVVSLWTLVNRYSSHRALKESFAARERSGRRIKPRIPLTADAPMLDEPEDGALLVRSKEESTIEALESRYGPDR